MNAGRHLWREPHARLLVAFLALLAVSCVAPPFPKYFALHHVPTLPTLIALIVAWRKWNMSLLSFGLVLTFMSLHVLGARYLYSYVPYDAWSEATCEINISQAFGWQRNQFDRLVHLAYGMLIVVPALRFAQRFVRVSDGWASILAVQYILATSTIYELIEWLIAVAMAPEWADSYNGQQGDVWDAHKDSLLALVGAVVVVIPVWIRRRRRASR